MIKKITLFGILAFPSLFLAQEKSKHSKIAIIPSVGLGWRTAETPKGLSFQEKEYIKGLKSGLNFDISAYYLLKNVVGIGVKYSIFNASNDGQITVQDNYGYSYTGYVHTKDQITFIGPSVLISNLNEETKHKLFVDMALGVITYTTQTGDVKGTGSTFGAEMNIAYQYQILQNILIGPKVGLSGGTLSKMKYNGVTYDFGEDQKEGLSRLSLSAAVTFRF